MLKVKTLGIELEDIEKNYCLELSNLPKIQKRFFAHQKTLRKHSKAAQQRLDSHLSPQNKSLDVI